MIPLASTRLANSFTLKTTDKSKRKNFAGGDFDLLEARRFLSADGIIDVDSAIISPMWFEQITNYGPSRSSRVISSFDDKISQIDWQDTAIDVVADEWIVQLDTNSAQQLQSVGEANTALGDDVDFEIVGGLGMNGQLLIRTFDATEDMVSDWLSSLKTVDAFEPNALMPVDKIANDTSFNSLWGVNNTGQTGGTIDADIDGPEAWDITTGNSNLVIGVIDTGVDYTHPDLAGNIWTNPGEIAGNGIDDDGNGFIDDVHGYDFVNNDGDPMDDNEHGTHVAGTIAASGNNSNGVTGVAWNASIMGLKFLSDTGSGSTADAIRAINYTTMMKSVYDVNIIATNNSWGGGGHSSALESAIAANASAEILFVAAAGNENANNNTTPSYPANYDLPNVISVASTTHRDQRSSFSNYGATTVDLAAPGSSILSTVPGGGYASFSGTSMAAPHVTGVAALAWSVKPNATVAEVKAAILDGVDSITSLDGLVETGGRLNAFNTLQELGLNVANASIGEGEVISSPVTDFTFSFSREYDNGSIDASDLTVNGTAADRFTLVDSSTVTFHYDSTPISSEGAQLLSIAADAITSDGLSINDWQRTFYYDSVQLQVLSTNPSDGDVLSNAPSSLEFHFNEPIDAQSVAISDLQISHGAVTSFSIIDNDSIRFGVDMDSTEVTVAYTLRSGAISDSNGSPNVAFQGEFEIDSPLVERFETNSPVSIVDNRVVFSRITVDHDYDIVDLNVELDITHTFDADLHVHLISPSGTVVELFTDVGGGGDNFDSTILDDESNRSIRQGEAPFRGEYRPEGSLSDFDGESTLGTWTLRVADNYMFDDGSINNWSLTIGHAGATVVSSNPAANSTVETALDTFTLDFSGAIDASTVVASDFTVNGIAANTATLIDASTVEYGFLTTPMTVTGNQQMALPAGSIQMAGNSDTVDAWQAEFDFAPYFGPELDPIADQVMLASQDALTIPFNAVSPDGNSLTVSVEATSETHEVQQQFGFYATAGMLRNDFYTNFRGAQEKYMRSSDGARSRAHFILPNGDIHRWNGRIDTSPLVTKVDSRYYDDLNQLLDLDPIEFSISDDSVTIQRPGQFVESIDVELFVSDGVSSVSEEFVITVANNQLTLAEIENQEMSHQLDRLEIPLSINNPSGESLSFTVDAGWDVSNAHLDIVERFSLHPTAGQLQNDYYYNLRGEGEKYLRGNNGRSDKAYFILPSGALHQWNGRIARSPQVASLDPKFHADPSLLFAPESTNDVAASVSGSILTIDPAEGMTGRIQVTVGVTNGTSSAERSFYVDILNTAPVFESIADITMSSQEDQRVLQLDAVDTEGDTLSYSVEVTNQALDIDQQYGLYALSRQIENNYYLNARGANEKYIRGQAGNHRAAYFILPDGSLHRWSQNLTRSPQVATLDTAYYEDPSLLYDAASFEAAVSGNNLTLDPASGFRGVVQIDVSVSDGSSSVEQTFQVSVSESVVAQSDRQTKSVDAVSLEEYDSCLDHVSDLSDEFASSIASQFAFEAYDPQSADETYLNNHGANEKYLRGSNGTSEFVFFLLPDGSLHQWRGAIGRSPLVAAVDSCYYESLDLLFEVSS